jgi:hypothetical protein
MNDTAMGAAWVGADNARRWELFSLMTPAQKRELVDLPHRDPVLHPYYQSKERVEIILTGGDRVRCYIGRSTGWAPAYLIVKRRDSTGGCAVSAREIESIRGLGIYR